MAYSNDIGFPWERNKLYKKNKVKKLFIILVVLTVILLQSCRIENPLIYSKDYTVGHNDLLRFDGYYIDTILLTTSKEANKYDGTILSSPLFFYEDGTVKIWPGLQKETDADSLLPINKKWGFTGIYKVENDNLHIEYWVTDSGSGVRYRQSLVLKITESKLQLIGRLNNNKEVVDIKKYLKRTYVFRKNLKKPIIKKNWIRERKKWNR